MASLLKVVPHTLCEPLPNYAAILPGALPAFLAADVGDIDAALGYIGGALAHQDCMANETENMISKVFKGVITGVTFIERKSGDYVLGKKAIVHFTAPNQKTKEIEAQEISTDWYEYHSYNPELESFWVALSQTVVAAAEDNIGVECLIRKSFKYAETAKGGNSVRYVASIIPIAGGKKADVKEAAPKSSSRSKPARDDDEEDDAFTISEVTKLIEADKTAGSEYDDADPKTAKSVVKIITETLNEEGFDDRYDKFVDLLDLIKISKSLKTAIEDALDQKTDKKIAAELFVIGIEELG